jgi:NAD(P) transhydrogenase subunit beta
MRDVAHLVVDAGIILVLVAGISQFRSPLGARRGNLIAALALVLAAATVVYQLRLASLPVVLPALLVGGSIGWLVAVRVNMVQIPAMVAFQHGMGGVAATLVSFVELTRGGGGQLAPVEVTAGFLGLIIGSATFSGSMVASGKLAGRVKQTPVVLPNHDMILLALTLAIVAVVFAFGILPERLTYRPLVVLAVASVVLGVVFSVRIGGADMPVLISFLNATAGLAAAFCGMTIQNRLLIACGATVAASGSILTHVMCKAMNRSLIGIFAGAASKPAVAPPPASDAASPATESEPAPPQPPPQEADRTQTEDPIPRAVEAARNARTVIIVPGYGMALAQAQFEVVQLGKRLEELGKQVRFAVHPVAGRMPGHMHVLLAEAEVEYDKLHEMDQINPEFKDTDLVLVVGACDVVNPAAIDKAGTPISGMPILMAHEARHIVVCNLDERPGYSGVENPLYRNPKTILVLGDAKANVGALLAALS